MTGGIISEGAASILVVLAVLALILLAVYARRQDKRELREAQRENALLAERVRALEQSTLPIAGVDQGEKTWTVLVDSQEVALKAMPPLAYASALNELPSFLFAYASAKTRGEDLSGEDLVTLVQHAKSWILVCALDREGVEPRLERLSVPEAMQAVVTISRLNGLGSQLAAFFQGRLDGPDARPHSEALRSAA